MQQQCNGKEKERAFYSKDSARQNFIFVVEKKKQQPNFAAVAKERLKQVLVSPLLSTQIAKKKKNKFFKNSTQKRLTQQQQRVTLRDEDEKTKMKITTKTI